MAQKILSHKKLPSLNPSLELKFSQMKDIYQASLTMPFHQVATTTAAATAEEI